MLVAQCLGDMTEGGASNGDCSNTRYHLLMADAGIVPAQPGKMAGEAGIGVILMTPLGEILERISERIGWVENHHVAEYQALIRGLEAAYFREIKYLRVRLDSAQVINQLTGKWRVKAECVKRSYEQAASLRTQFVDTELVRVPREANGEAHALARIALRPLRAKQLL